MTGKQTNKRMNNEGKLISEEEVGLPPILPWMMDIFPKNITPDEKRLMSLPLKAYSLVGFTHNNPLICKQKEELLLKFQTECHAVLFIVSEQVELLKFNSPQDRLSYYNDYDSFCKKLVGWTKESVRRGFADKPKLLDLMSEQLSLYTRSGAMYSITKDEFIKIAAILKREKEPEKSAGTGQSPPSKTPPEIELIKQIIKNLQEWETKFLPDNPQAGKIELVEIVTGEELKRIVERLQWDRHKAEVESLKAECAKILRWFHTSKGVLSNDDENNPFIAIGIEQIKLKLTDVLHSILTNLKADLIVKKPAVIGQEMPPTKQQPWRDNALDYILLSEAIVKFADNKLVLSTTSKKITPDGPVRYMRRGQRCKVHIGDFRDYIQKHHPAIDLAGEIADEYMADVEANKAKERMRRNKQQNA